MAEFGIISVDMFQTLVDITSRRHFFWKELLEERYSEELAEAYWQLTSMFVLDYFHKLTKQEQFLTVKAIFERCLNELLSAMSLDFDPRSAARILAAQHGLASPYEDTSLLFDLVVKKFPICLVTDADDDMLSPSLVDLCGFDQVFTSEQARSYKNDPECKLFIRVIEHYGIEAEEIFHIGDSSTDVLGAHRVGIKACWLNRGGKSWRHSVEPDFTVSSLSEVISLL
jgi:2-haloalkanoic acid dehalogenase type II